MWAARNGLWAPQKSGPTFDVAGTTQYEIGSTDTTTISPTKTDYILAAVACTTASTFTATCGGVSMTRLLSAYQAGVSVSSYITLFGLAGVSAGSGISIVTAASTGSYYMQGAIGIANVTSVAVGTGYQSDASSTAIGSGGSITIGGAQLGVDVMFINNGSALNASTPRGSNKLWGAGAGAVNVSLGMWVASGANTTFGGALASAAYWGAVPVIFS